MGTEFNPQKWYTFPDKAYEYLEFYQCVSHLCDIGSQGGQTFYYPMASVVIKKSNKEIGIFRWEQSIEEYVFLPNINNSEPTDFTSNHILEMGKFVQDGKDGNIIEGRMNMRKTKDLKSLIEQKETDIKAIYDALRKEFPQEPLGEHVHACEMIYNILLFPAGNFVLRDVMDNHLEEYIRTYRIKLKGE